MAEKIEEAGSIDNPAGTLLCECEICTPYSPQGICAPMQPIGWCIRCGKPETVEQVESLSEQAKDFLMTQNFRVS